MDFLKLAKKRYACRKYLSRQVEPEKLELILEAGRVAPTGANRQPQRLPFAAQFGKLLRQRQPASRREVAAIEFDLFPDSQAHHVVGVDPARKGNRQRG